MRVVPLDFDVPASYRIPHCFRRLIGCFADHDFLDHPLVLAHGRLFSHFGDLESQRHLCDQHL
jgi:hypothetical protein